MTAATSGFESVMEAKRTTREAAIARLLAEARDRGQNADRSFWAMVYDFELAPMTTNRKQLAELGVEVVASASLADDELSVKLREIVDMLGRLNVYLLHTNHLSDRELYEKLAEDILDEEVRDLPPDGHAREFIDLCIAETEEEWERFERHYGGGEGSVTPPFDRDATLPRPPGGPW